MVMFWPSKLPGICLWVATSLVLAPTWAKPSVFEVEWLSNAFVMTFENRPNWKANSVMADPSRFKLAVDNDDLGGVSSTFTFSSHARTFQSDRTVYLWRYTTDQPTNKWVLLTEASW
jgi:hypothetical protein